MLQPAHTNLKDLLVQFTISLPGRKQQIARNAASVRINDHFIRLRMTCWRRGIYHELWWGRKWKRKATGSLVPVRSNVCKVDISASACNPSSVISLVLTHPRMSIVCKDGNIVPMREHANAIPLLGFIRGTCMSWALFHLLHTSRNAADSDWLHNGQSSKATMNVSGGSIWLGVHLALIVCTNRFATISGTAARIICGKQPDYIPESWCDSSRTIK